MIPLLLLNSIYSRATPVVNHTENSPYKIKCADAKQCSSSVAGILSDKKNVCTGVLVGPDLLATNLHCLPLNLRKKNASCKDRILISFPETKDFPEEFLNCRKVIAISSSLKDTPVTPDYAFVRVNKPTHRHTLKINNEGIFNNEILTIAKIDPIGSQGLLRQITCKATQGSLLNPLFKSAQSSVISLIPCEIISGNSGSPVLSGTNQVKGLINSKGIPADIPLSADQFQVAFASNFSCLEIPELGFKKKSSDCQNDLDHTSFQNASGVLVREAVHNLIPHFSKNVGDQLQIIHEQTKHFLKWETNQQDIPYTGDSQKPIAKVKFQPKCILAARDHLMNMQEKISLQYSEWGIQLHLDSEGRPTPQLASEEIHSTISFSKRDIELNAIPIKLNQTDFTLPFCSE